MLRDVAVLFFFGVATWYGGPYVGEPLYCGGRYEAGAAPWVAVDVGGYEGGMVYCGDVMRLFFESGEVLRLRAMDAGPFGRYFIEDWPGRAIVADVPAHLWPCGDALSAPVRMVNESAAQREFERWAGR